jgi:uncharacterized protein HemX
MDKVGRIVAAVALVIAVASAVTIYLKGPTNLDPEVAQWVNDQFNKNTVASKVQELIDKEKAETAKAQAEVERLKKELEVKAPKGK